MKNLILISFSFLMFLSCKTTDKQEKKTIKEIPQLTLKHKLIPGTRVSIIPDSGLMIQNKYPQLIDANGVQIGFSDIPYSFYNVKNMHTREAYANIDNVELLRLKNTKHNKYDALEITTIKETYGIKSRQFILMFGNNQNILTLVADIPFKEFDSVPLYVRHTLESAIFEPGRFFDPSEILDFSIEVDRNLLKLVAAQPYEAIYAEMGQYGDIDRNLGRNFEILKTIGEYEKKPEFLKDLMNIHAMKWGEIEFFESKNITIGSFKGIEGSGQVIDKYTNDKILVYGAIIFVSDNIVYIVKGDSKHNNEQDIELYKEIVRTFRLKK